MFTIKNFSVAVDKKIIVNDVSLICQPGTVHALMGPNGSGKSTLALALLGHPKYTVITGSVTISNDSLIDLPIHKRAQAGLFIGFQHPQEIPGVKMVVFLHEMYNALQQASVGLSDFKTAILYPILDALHIDHSFIYRDLNDGFSGGEKKRFELLQLLLSNAKVAVLDEIDSGLDIDSLKLVAQTISYLRKNNPSLVLILITHYRRILDLIEPDYVHILCNGNIVTTGTTELVHQLEAQGYDEYL